MWAPVEGRYGRTRDGRKVGPMVLDLTTRYYPDYPWRCAPNDAPGMGLPFWTEDGYYRKGDTDHPLDLVAKWVDDGPVRTVTRQEIVPGTYGRLGVGEAIGGVVAVGWVGHHNTPYPRLTADELDAAARVLAQLAEALRNGQ